MENNPSPFIKGDRRVQRTRRQLRNALMSLILEKGYDAVTVEDITSRADLGRTTFYLHYKDKEELLIESIDSIANELKAQVDLLGTHRPNRSTQPRPIHLAFHHAAENADLYRIILKGEGATKAATRLRQIISDGATDYMLATYATLPHEARQATAQINADPTFPNNQARLKLVGDFLASSLLGFITWWLEAGMPYPPDQMADFFLEAFFKGANNYIQSSTSV